MIRAKFYDQNGIVEAMTLNTLDVPTVGSTVFLNGSVRTQSQPFKVVSSRFEKDAVVFRVRREDEIEVGN